MSDAYRQVEIPSTHEDDPHGEEWLHRHLPYRVSSIASVGSLAVGVAYHDGGRITHLAQVMEPGLGVYAYAEPVSDPGSGKPIQIYSGAMWEEFLAGIKNREFDFEDYADSPGTE